MIHNIPMELRERIQWVCAGPDKLPLNPRTGQAADVTDPSTWGSFYEATRTGMMHVGYVLSASDPYCIIDLDNKPEKPLSAEEWAVHEKILTAFESYTERSQSKRGYHIIVRAQTPKGYRRGNVEVYSAERYMICTGDVVRNAPIVDAQSLIDSLISQMTPRGEGAELVDIEGTLTDAELHDMAINAANGEKYDALTKGLWKEMGYPSQSEADFALLSILTFYSRDNEQVRRMFRYSALGKREKATRDNRYLDTCLRAIRAKQESPLDLERAAENARALLATLPAPVPLHVQAQSEVDQALAIYKTDPAEYKQALATVQQALLEPVQEETRAPTHARAQASNYELPPGIVGELATYFYSTAVRPVQEVALSAAICLLAGVVGRSFNVSGTGLNQYMLLIAKTGTGKEGIAKGISRLLSAIRPQVPMVDDFIGPSAFASGQALIRVLDKHPCFVSVLGEFGYTLQTLNDPRAPAPVLLLKRVLLDLYGKSGWDDVLRSTAYSDVEKNTKNVHAPAVTLLGESTPEAFYEGINAGDIADGLIPRMHIMEYHGERPSRNKNASTPPSPELAARFADIVAVALTMQNNNSCASVQLAPDGLAALDKFDDYCDAHMRAASGAGELQLWNRAHLKALKLAALLAVGCNPMQPIITAELAHWAINFTMRGTEQILSRFFAGDVGQGDAKRMSDLRRIISEYFQYSKEQLRSYKADPALQASGLVPYAYIIVRCARVASFYKDPRGAARSVRATLETLEEMEVLTKADALTTTKRFGKTQSLYSVGNGW